MPVQSTRDRLRPGLLERFGIAGAVSGIAVVLVLGLLLVTNGQLESANRASLRSARILQLAEASERELVLAETSTRAYLLTGRPQYADAARRSLAETKRDLAALAGDVRDDPDQAQRVAGIRAWTAGLASRWMMPSLAQHVNAARPYRASVTGEQARAALERRYGRMIAEERRVEGAQLEQVHTLHHRVWYTGLAAILAIPLLLFLFRIYVGFALLEPVRALAQLAGRVEQGDEGAVGEVRGPREIAQLQDAFNRMSSTVGQRRREILDHAPITIWEVVGRQIRWISPYWRALAGTGVDDPASLDDIDERLHPEDLPYVAEARRKGMATMQPFEYRCRLVRPDGQIRWIWTRVNPMGMVGSEPRAIGFTLDVTDDERTRQELAHAQRLESVGHLAGGVAHDFNNLLTVISGYATLAQMRKEDPSRLDEPLAEIVAAAQRASALTRQLLMFSREQSVELQQLDLNEVVRTVLPMLERLIEERISLLCRLADDLPPIRFDRGQLEQVIVNLAVNARDAIPASGRIVIATCAVGEGAQRAVRLSVTDDGLGMDQATLEHIFDPFFTTKPPGEGTGLGLSTVHGIVARGGGHIEVDSRPGTGTTFSIFFPAVQDLAAVA